ncbi:MAG TPA: DUF6194 family protein [Solirubrobacteraceae bacterium]|nr:DUF6194 family protein [Solirubrobacteraceae bacterium]
MAAALEPEAILRDLLALDPALRRERYYGEDAVFYNPGGVAPLGVILAAIKDHDGPNDSSARLSRDGVYRFAFGMAPESFVRRFGAPPARPAKGAVVSLAGYDPTRLDELMPHPVYAWMSWVQILAPTAAAFESLRPLLGESLDLVRAMWNVHHSRDAAVC